MLADQGFLSSASTLEVRPRILDLFAAEYHSEFLRSANALLTKT